MGDLTCIDLDPTRAGVCGQVFVWAHDGGPERVVAPSYAALFAEFARELTEGRYAVQVNKRGDAYLDRVE